MKRKNLQFSVCLALIAILGLSFQVNAQDINSDLVAYYPLDGDGASGIEGGTNGEVLGAAVAGEGILEKADGSIQITAQGDAITMPDADIALPMEDQVRSMSIWYKADETLEVAYLISYGTPDDTQKGAHLHLAYRRNDGVIRIGHWWADYDFEVEDLADGEWHHIAYTFDGTTFVCYLDGESIGTKDIDLELPAVFTISNEQLALGCRNHPDLNDPAIGFIDEARIYARVLTAEDITAIYNFDPDNPPVVSVVTPMLVETAIYPNPASDMVSVNTTEVIINVQFYDLSGKLALESVEETIDISSLASGIYLTKVETASGTSITKIIKE